MKRMTEVSIYVLVLGIIAAILFSVGIFSASYFAKSEKKEKQISQPIFKNKEKPARRYWRWQHNRNHK